MIDEIAEDPPSSPLSNDDLLKIRIAPVMTGGTSLAVWIGGVTAELYRVVNGEPAGSRSTTYQQILDLTQSEASVDVITGTSAGGLNGVLLATAWAHRSPTEIVVGMRETWMTLGSIDELLRSSSESDPPSLLRGDDYFWPSLTQVLEQFAASGGSSREQGRDVDLLVTMTSLEGEPVRRTDDSGTSLDERNFAHHVLFDKDAFFDDGWARRVALAARTSASIPGVFEASFLPLDDQPNGGRPGFRHAHPTFASDMWAVDGGVLVNQPVRYALDLIFARTAKSDIRRIAMYVNPTPETVAARTADDPTKTPELRRTLGILAAAPAAQKISADLDQLAQHNRDASRAVDVRRALGSILTGEAETTDQLRDWARDLYPSFRTMRFRLSVDAMLDRAYTDSSPDSERRRTELAGALMMAAETAWLPESYPSVAAAGWIWGIWSLEYVTGMLFDILRRAYRVSYAAGTEGASVRRLLGSARGAIHDCWAGVAPIRDVDDDYWRGRVEKLTTTTDLADWAQTSYEEWPNQVTSDPDPIPLTDALRGRAETMARCAENVREAIDALLAHVTARPAALSDHIATLEESRVLLTPRPASAERPNPMLARLVDLHVVAVSFGDVLRKPQRVEFREVSFREPNTLDGRSPEQKLAGTEFRRLGAFIKPSWRANDWMWGRLDGASQMVRILLDPARLRELNLNPNDVCTHFAVGTDDRAAVMAELSGLQSDPTIADLPALRKLLTKRLQIEIAREELPHVHEAVLTSNERHAAEQDFGHFRRFYETHFVAASAPTDAAVIEVLHECKIGKESAKGEVGHDMLTGIAGRMIAVGTAAITGENSGLKWPRRFLVPVRRAGQLTGVVARTVTTDSNTARTGAMAGFAVAGAILALAMFGAAVNAGVTTIAALVLILGIGLVALRSRTIGILPIAFVLLIVAVTVIGSDLKYVITSNSKAVVVATAKPGDTLDARGRVVLQSGSRLRAFHPRAETPLTVAEGTVVVTRTQEPSWRRVVLVGPWSALKLVIGLVMLGWFVGAALTVIATLRKGTRPVPLAQWMWLGASAVGGIVALLVTTPLVSAVFVGKSEGWRSVSITVASWLSDRGVVVTVLLMTLVGAFIGLGWDRVVAKSWRERAAGPPTP